MYARRDRAGGRGSLSRRTRSRSCPCSTKQNYRGALPLGPNVRVFQGPWADLGLKSNRFYAGNLVSRGLWAHRRGVDGGHIGTGAHGPGDGLPRGRLTRTQNWRDLRRPLKFPSLQRFLTRPVPCHRGECGSPHPQFLSGQTP